MYSLMITVEAICFFPSYKDILLLNQYSINVESSLSHGEEYLIPSLIWPPPPPNNLYSRLLMKLIPEVVS